MVFASLEFLTLFLPAFLLVYSLARPAWRNVILLIGSWLFPQLGVEIGSGMVSAIVAATIGAVLLLLILRLFSRGGRW
mgnify:CR=1 FL=1